MGVAYETKEDEEEYTVGDLTTMPSGQLKIAVDSFWARNIQDLELKQINNPSILKSVVGATRFIPVQVPGKYNYYAISSSSQMGLPLSGLDTEMNIHWGESRLRYVPAEKLGELSSEYPNGIFLDLIDTESNPPHVMSQLKLMRELEAPIHQRPLLRAYMES